MAGVGYLGNDLIPQEVFEDEYKKAMLLLVEASMVISFQAGVICSITGEELGTPWCADVLYRIREYLGED